MMVLTWNLFHGRSVPDAPREQLADFAARLAGWEWDVALLQEVPPWWAPTLGRASGASARTALTSRNWVLPVSRWAARRRPDVIKSWGGGANAILVRDEAIAEHRVRTLRAWPERRVVHGVRLERGWWGGNLHATAHSETRARRSSWASRPGRATASTTSSCDWRTRRRRGVRWIAARSRTTSRCSRRSPRNETTRGGVVMNMTRILLALCAVVALAAAGCGSSNSSSSSSSTTSS